MKFDAGCRSVLNFSSRVFAASAAASAEPLRLSTNAKKVTVSVLYWYKSFPAKAAISETLLASARIFFAEFSSP